jgi:multicomponent Na+:H+ antiporter subunit D
MISTVPPAAIFITGGLLVPFIKGKWKSAFLLLIPVVGFINLISIPVGTHWVFRFLGYDLIFGKMDRLSLLFGYIYHIITFIALLYSLHVKDDLQHVAGLIYSGSALGVVFAGDLLSLFIFWEMLTTSSVMLIWSRRTRASLHAGFRYFLVHAAGGLCLLAGIVLYVQETGSIEFGHIGLHGVASLLIFLGFGVNSAWPLLHPWLPDAYPESTPTGTVFLSVYTSKTAVYVLARGFAGTEALIWIGAIMTVFPVFFAVIENNLRRVLSYSLINQVGYMVCGIGIGTQLAINGAISHVFAHIIYKALLFMSMGAVLHRTGKINCTALGGLYRTMPFTAICCIIAAASISGFPFTSGFVTKSMTITAAAANNNLIWFLLMIASVGVLEHAGIKVPYFAFFGHDSGLRPKEAPLNMCLAMGISAFLCIAIGVFPGYLYNLLPYPVDFVPYTASHVVGMAQLLLFATLAFVFLVLSGVYPSEKRCVNLDVDWFYRMGGRLFYSIMDKSLNGINAASEKIFVGGLAGYLGRISRDAPTRAALLAMVPSWVISGTTGEKLARKKASLSAALETGSSPIGISAAIATIFLVVIFLLM